MIPFCLCNIPNFYLAADLDGEMPCIGEKPFATVTGGSFELGQERQLWR